MNRYGEAERLLANTIGLNPEVLGSRVIRGEVDALMKTLKIEDLGLCLKELVASEEKMGQFIERIVVPETWFFRDRESFRFLKQYARHIAADRREGPLRVLSVPCSTGEEPYSIAITLTEAGLSPGSFHIDAIDISRAALRVAKKAEYGRSSFRGETKFYEEKYFNVLGDRLFLSPSIAGLVHFHHDNVLRDGFLADCEPYHMVFCKNLLIYLNLEARSKLFACLGRLLHPEGVLFTGHSELASFLQYGYEAVKHSRSFACRKSGGPSEAAPSPSPSVRTMKWKALKPLSLPGQIVPPPVEKKTRDTHDAGASATVRDPAKPSLDSIRMLADRGSLDEASDLCAVYLKGRGGEKEAHCLMGLINHALNHLDSAEGCFLKALYLDPGYYEALLHMSLLCDRKGDRARADIFRQRMKRLEEARRDKESGS